jgi:hypothetical protein
VASGLGIALRSMWKRRLETGTGFAYAKLSEILPSARVARFVRMTHTLA